MFVGANIDVNCETNSVIKLAAAATGSHEVLSVLFANGKKKSNTFLVEIYSMF
jgi:hypothetical protein